jgi:hypothetical protein
MGIEIAAVAGIGGGLAAAYGAYQGAQAEAAAARDEARLKEIYASEVMRRKNLNEAEILREGNKLLGTQKAVQVGQGGSVSSGNLIMAQADAEYSIRRSLMNNQLEAEFTAFNARESARSTRFLASETEKAGNIEAFGSLLTTGSRFARMGA